MAADLCECCGHEFGGDDCRCKSTCDAPFCDNQVGMHNPAGEQVYCGEHIDGEEAHQ